MADNAASAGALGSVMAVVSTVKCLALIVFGVAMLRIAPYRRVLARHVGRIGQAIWVHRLATLAILVIVVLACIPAADLLDQLPDVQRQWADGFRVGARRLRRPRPSRDGARHVRARTSPHPVPRARRAHSDFSRKPAAVRLDAAIPWLIAPALLLAAGVLVVVLAAAFGGRRSCIHCRPSSRCSSSRSSSRSSAVAGHTWVSRHPETEERRDPRASAEPHGSSATASPSSCSCGRDRRRALVRRALRARDAGRRAERGRMGVGRRPARRRCRGVSGHGSSFAGWDRVPGEARTRSERTRDDDRRPGGSRVRSRREPTAVRGSRLRRRSSSSSFIVALACLVAGMFFPIADRVALGGVAVTLLAISAWVAVFGAFTLIVQSRELIAPFRWLRLEGVAGAHARHPAAVRSQPRRLVLRAGQTLHAVQVSNPRARRQPSRMMIRSTTTRSDAATTTDDHDGQRHRGAARVPHRRRGRRHPSRVLDRLRARHAREVRRSIGLRLERDQRWLGRTRRREHRRRRRRTTTGPRRKVSAPRRERAAEIVDRAKRVAGPDVVSTVVLGLAVGDVFAAGSGVHVPSYLGPTRWR